MPLPCIFSVKLISKHLNMFLSSVPWYGGFGLVCCSGGGLFGWYMDLYKVCSTGGQDTATGQMKEEFGVQFLWWLFGQFGSTEMSASFKALNQRCRNYKSSLSQGLLSGIKLKPRGLHSRLMISFTTLHKLFIV
ncbi:hypothetical protein ACSBR2_016896 [Camellia fascicularis]